MTKPLDSPSMPRAKTARSTGAQTAPPVITDAPHSQRDVFAAFCARHILYHNKGVRAIYLEYSLLLEPGEKTRFQALGELDWQKGVVCACHLMCLVVMRLRNELELDIRRYGIALRAAERKQEREARLELERAQAELRAAEEAAKREKRKQLAAEKKRAQAAELRKQAAAAKRAATAQLKAQQKARFEAMMVVPWQAQPVPPACEARTQEVVLEPLLEIAAVVVETPAPCASARRFTVAVAMERRAVTPPPVPIKPKSSIGVLSLEEIFSPEEARSSEPAISLISPSDCGLRDVSTSSSGLFSPESATGSEGIVAGGQQVETSVDLLDLSSSEYLDEEAGALDVRDPLARAEGQARASVRGCLWTVSRRSFSSQRHSSQMGGETARTPTQPLTVLSDEESDEGVAAFVTTSRGASAEPSAEEALGLLRGVSKWFKRASTRRKFGGDRTNNASVGSQGN